MGGTVARDEGGEIVLDERGRPQFGGGMFGQIAQDLLADERAMNLAAQEEANTALAALASGELDAAALAQTLNMTPEQFMAAQSSGIDLAGILESRDQFDRTMAAQGIDPTTDRPYGFDTTTGLTAAQQEQIKQFNIANLINPETEMPYGFDPATGLTAGQTLAQENVELGLLSQGMDMRPTITINTSQGVMTVANPDYGRPIGWDPETGMGIADANAMALAEEEMELSTAMAQADLLTNAAALSQVDNPFVQAFMNNLSATFGEDVEGYNAVMQQITSALVASGNMELNDSNLARILDELPPEYTPLVEQLVMDSFMDAGGVVGDAGGISPIDETTATMVGEGSPEAGIWAGQQPEKEFVMTLTGDMDTIDNLQALYSIGSPSPIPIDPMGDTIKGVAHLKQVQEWVKDQAKRMNLPDDLSLLGPEWAINWRKGYDWVVDERSGIGRWVTE
jgi:hypothetical protein